jgi:hypothetical protein
LWLNGKVYLVELQNLMAKKHSNRIDMLLPSKEKCSKFGVAEGLLIPADQAVGKRETTRSGKS